MQRAASRWRRFVLDHRSTRVAFWLGIAVFLAGVLAPDPVGFALISRAFPAWFGLFVLYLASIHVLDAAASSLSRDFWTAGWLAAWTALLGAVAASALALAINGID